MKIIFVIRQTAFYPMATSGKKPNQPKLPKLTQLN